MMAKRLFSLCVTAILLIGACAGGFSAGAAERIKATGCRVVQEGNYIYLDFFLSEKIKAARNFQTTDRVEEPSDYPDALVDAANKYIKFNGVTIAEYSEMNNGSQYVLMLHYEMDKKDPNLQLFRIAYQPAGLPGGAITDRFTFTVEEGMITCLLYTSPSPRDS